MTRSRKLMISSLAAGLFAALTGTDLRAHDFWIEPASFVAEPGTTIPVTLRVGQDLAGDSVPFIPNWFSDYRAIGAGTEYPILAVIGDDPAGDVTPESPGLYVIGYRSTTNFVEMGPVKFDQYLADEGLDWVRALRLERGEGGSAGRETYSRCAKSLIRIGDADSAGFDRVLGYTLELIPERDPYQLAPGATLPVQLLYESKPISDILVVAFTDDRPADKVTARTDADGRVELKLTRAGTWLIKAVHIIETPDDAGSDWESFWASLTFRLSAT